MIDIASCVGWPGMAPGNKATVVFQTGFTGSTGFVLSFNPVDAVISSRMKKPCIKAPRVTPLENAFASSSQSIFHLKNNKPQMNADKRGFVNLVSAILGFFFKVQSEGYENNSN